MKAIRLYRNNGFVSEANLAQKSLERLQIGIAGCMHVYSSSHDLRKDYDNLCHALEGRTFKEYIVYITMRVPIMARSDLLEESLRPITSFFTKSIRDEKGGIVAILPPIDLSSLRAEDGSIDIDVIEDSNSAISHMHLTAYLRQKFYGDTVLNWAVDLLNHNFKYSADDLRFLVEGNPIIPPNRGKIFLTGLYNGLKGDLYSALHILAPQVENMFRFIAELCGATTNYLNKDDSFQARLLEAVFNLPELKDCYDNDILFLFKGMMREKVGANIRNRIAHGLMEESDCYGGYSLFFLCAVMKLLSFTSLECHEIFSKIKESNSSDELTKRNDS